jgi:hypothetical protein
MGLFRRKREQAIPKPGTPEFEEAVEGSALPDDQSVSMGEEGWAKPEPESPDQADEEEKPKRREGIIRGMARRVPNQGGFGAGIPGPKKKT